MAQRGTRALWAVFGVMFAACSTVTVLPADAGSGGSAQPRGGSAAHPEADGGKAIDAGCAPAPCPTGATWDPVRCVCGQGQVDAGPPAECSVDSDCVLMPRACCSDCAPPTRDAVLAIAKSRESAAYQAQCPQQVLCAATACSLTDDSIDPLAPVLHAGCIANRCEIVDLRQADLSRCTTDADCRAIRSGCCPPDSEWTGGYVGVTNGADTSILQCSPIPPCVPPQAHAEPLAFCASDGHCAVRHRETRDGKASVTCYSPTQNLEHAYDANAVGCDCAINAAPGTCAHDATGRAVTLDCTANGWQSAEDGACWRGP